MPRRTKIVCTLGPASSGLPVIRELIRAGMDVARLNLSHGTHKDHSMLLESVREAADLEGCVVPILLDLQGPKIRVGDVEGGEIVLEKGARTTLTKDPIGRSTSDLIHVGYPTIAEDMTVGNVIRLDDGRLELRVVDIRDGKVEADIVVGGRLASRKGVNLPNIRTSTPSITEKDLDDLAFGLEHGVEMVALSFVRDEHDVEDLVHRVSEVRHPPMVIAKIEKPEAVERIDAIIEAADAVMVARGDLGIEMRLSRVPGAQKHIIKGCLEAARPVVTATQMLESMIEKPVPTRAEVSDVANAVLDGTDAVMLSGETAVGKYPVECVRVMADVIESAERDCGVLISSSFREIGGDVTEAVSLTATQLAAQVGATAIACLTASGRTARTIASHRPEIPVYAFTDDERVVGQLALTWGTKGFYLPFQADTDRGITQVHEVLKKHGYARDGDRLVITAGMPLPAKGRTNMVHVSSV